MQQMIAIDINKKNISNNEFMGLKKLTTSSNECRHKNMKYGGNRIQTNSMLASTAKGIVTNKTDSLNLELQRIAQDVLNVPTWNRFDLNVGIDNQKHILSEWNARGKYHIARVSDNKWYVLYSGSTINDELFKPKIKRVRAVSFNGNGYECTCKLFNNIGFCCRHIFSVGVAMSKYCFHIRYWKDYCFYYLREGTPDNLNNSFSRLRKINYVIAPVIPSSVSYPNFNNDDITMETFNQVRLSPYPIIKNWPQDLVTLAIQMDSDPTYNGNELSQESNIEDGLTFSSPKVEM